MLIMSSFWSASAYSLINADPLPVRRKVALTGWPSESLPCQLPCRLFKTSNDSCGLDCASPGEVQTSSANNVTTEDAFIVVSPCLILFFSTIEAPTDQRVGTG